MVPRVHIRKEIVSILFKNFIKKNFYVIKTPIIFHGKRQKRLKKYLIDKENSKSGINLQMTLMILNNQRRGEENLRNNEFFGKLFMQKWIYLGSLKMKNFIGDWTEGMGWNCELKYVFKC